MPKRKNYTTRFDGTEVIDAKAPIVIKVTKRDVVGAKRKDPENCAVAQSVKRCCHVDQVRVHSSRTYVRKHRTSPWERYETPAAVRLELLTFDRGAEFQEDEYVLRPVRKGQRAGDRAKFKPNHRNTGTGKARSKAHVFQGVRHMAPHGHGDHTTAGK